MEVFFLYNYNPHTLLVKIQDVVPPLAFLFARNAKNSYRKKLKGKKTNLLKFLYIFIFKPHLHAKGKVMGECIDWLLKSQKSFRINMQPPFWPEVNCGGSEKQHGVSKSTF